ncbi:MAG: 2-oxoacid:acceptor oxidoreductase family protein [Deltaproteobacteria bacterium]|nr:2-oxoacid:acceptor oxidoreductase family protein [Deltaproteobacteria bacterium]
MQEIRFHGRGGQGAVTSAEVIAEAAIELGLWAQSMPSFGPERRGAPVLAYLRVSKEPIRIRAEVAKPDIVVVLDDSLIFTIDVASGLKADGLLVINSTQSEDIIRKETGFGGKIARIEALKIAMECLGVPITNTTMIGALIKASGIIPLEAAQKQLSHRFNPKLAEKNATALKKAFESTTIYAPKKISAAGKKAAAKKATWRDILPGALVENPGGSKANLTGDWRSQMPVYDKEKCSKCGLCYVFCPDAAITIRDDKYVDFNYDYCKGCGICAMECPADAIAMEAGKKKK